MVLLHGVLMTWSDLLMLQWMREHQVRTDQVLHLILLSAFVILMTCQHFRMWYTVTLHFIHNVFNSVLCTPQSPTNENIAADPFTSPTQSESPSPPQLDCTPVSSVDFFSKSTTSTSDTLTGLGKILKILQFDLYMARLTFLMVYQKWHENVTIWHFRCNGEFISSAIFCLDGMWHVSLIMLCLFLRRAVSWTLIFLF